VCQEANKTLAFYLHVVFKMVGCNYYKEYRMTGMTAKVERTDWMSNPTESFMLKITEMNHR
jgi:hypothetical protein